MKTTRRNFLMKASVGSVIMTGIPRIVSAAFESHPLQGITLKKDDVILFQGDSITDVQRKRSEQAANNPSALGDGYPFMVASELLRSYPVDNLKIFNRGISGNKVYQLAERWDADCLALKPGVLSILIGVNDFWHTLVNNYSGTVKTYKDDFTALLDRTKQQVPEVKLIIGEPFAVPGVRAVDDTWFPVFNDYQKAAKEIAEKFNAVFIPYQTVFDEAKKLAPASYWTYDGVHPTLAGASLMAQAWLKAIEK